VITIWLISIIIMIGIIATAGGISLVVILWRGPRLVFTVRPRSPRQRPPAHRPQLAGGLEKEPCNWCSGGTQWHDPATATWGPIPDHLLYRVRMDDGDYDCRDPLHTGLRPCNNCAGFGRLYRDVSSSYQN
jgi:hypothetical protein